MDTPTNGDDMGNLNANRNTIADAAQADAARTSAASPSARTTETINTVAAPVVVASFDWKKYLPWIVGIILLLVVVWAFSRKRGGGGGTVSA